MSYAQMRRWNRQHPKGTRQPIILSTGSGFWPSHAFMTEDYFPYVERCKAEGVEPMDCEHYYYKSLREQP